MALKTSGRYRKIALAVIAGMSVLAIDVFAAERLTEDSIFRQSFEPAVVQLAQADTRIKPQIQITEGDTEAGKIKIFPADAPRVKPVDPNERLVAPPQKSDAAKTWEIISATRDLSVLDRFIAKYPGTIQAALAAQKKGELARATPQAAPEPARTVEPAEPLGVIETPRVPENLALDIQIELRRLGCSPGNTDGNWGAQSSRAARQFSRQTGFNVETAIPNNDLLTTLRATSAPACRLICGTGQTVVNGQCAAKICPSGQRLSSKGQCYRVKTVKTCKAGQKLSSKGRCYTPKAKTKVKTRPKVKKTKTVKSCRRGEKLSARGICVAIKKRVVQSTRPAAKKKRICTTCERSNGLTMRVCGRQKINSLRARGECG